MYTHTFCRAEVLIEVYKNNNSPKEFEGCLHNKDIVINNPKEILQYLELDVKQDSTKKSYNISKGESKATLNMINCKLWDKKSTIIDSIYFDDLKIFLESIEQNSIYKIEVETCMEPVNYDEYYVVCKIYIGILHKETLFLNKKVQGLGNIKVTLNDLHKIGWTKMHCGYIDIATNKISAPSYKGIEVKIIPSKDGVKSNYEVEEDSNFKFEPNPEIKRVHRDLSQQDVDNLNKSIKLANINTKEKLYLFLSQIVIETQDFKKIVESGGNSKTKPIRNDVRKYFLDYSGYKYKYRGAGTIQLTHWYNYEELKNYTGDNQVYLEGCEYVAFTYPWLVAGFFLDKNKISNTLDSIKTIDGKIKKLTETIKGTKIKYSDIEERTNAYNKIKGILEK